MARLRALIIDSSVDNNEVIVRLLCGIGHIPVQAKSQKEALEFLSSTEQFDYFILNLVLPFDEGTDADFNNGLGLIEQIRDYYPRGLEYPTIVFSGSLIDNDLLGDCMEAGANRFLPFDGNVPKDKALLARTIRRLTDKALAKRNSKIVKGQSEEINLESVHQKLAAKYKLVADLKAMEIFFNGIKLPSGKDGLQQRHKVFLFILAKNPGKAMSFEQIREEIRKYRLDEFADPSRNIRSQIRSTLRETAKKHPGKITEENVKAFLKTARYDLTRLALDPEDIFTIHDNEEYL